MRAIRLIGAFVGWLLLACVTAGAQQAPDLTELDLEHLANIQVTSVSRKEQRVFRSAAAIFVITGEDIRRSGATSLPEVLRMAPGVSVARINGSAWAVSARGFNARYANKMLVLIDGRSVYSPMFSGVYWDLQDVMLEDVDRIEVIRGPGATMWGANAVNGVINILTHTAASTQGGLATLTAGNDARAVTSFRYGGATGAGAHYRLFARYSDRAGEIAADGSPARDSSRMLHTGFRADWSRRRDLANDSFTIQGDAFGTFEHALYTLPSLAPPYSRSGRHRDAMSGGNVLGRWVHTDAHGELHVQLFYDATSRHTYLLGERHDTGDIDVQYSFRKGRHGILAGGGYRAIAMQVGGLYAFPVPRTVDNVSSAFIEDEVTLIPEKLAVTAGIKLEHNPYSGFQQEPSARVLWTPSERHALWAAVASAVRVPSLADAAIRLQVASFATPGGVPAVIEVRGSPGFRAEDLANLELGYRVRPRHDFALDVATFAGHYRNLRTLLPAPAEIVTTPVPRIIFPYVFSNGRAADSAGMEVNAQWDVRPGFTLTGSYSYLYLNDHERRRVLYDYGRIEGDSPTHQGQVHSHFTLRNRLEFDAVIYAVSALSAQPVPRYLMADFRTGWRGDSWALSAGVRGAFHARRIEFDGTVEGMQREQLRRAFFVNLTRQF